MENTTSSHKTKIDLPAVQCFLEHYYKSPVSNITAISGGESSQAFCFTINGENLILRVNRHNDQGFKKDHYAYINFKSEHLPIPEIKYIGKIDDSQYCVISEKVNGSLFKNLSDEEFDETLPSLFDSMKEIHSIDVSSKNGYGKWNETGKAPYKTWKDVLLDTDGFAGELFENPLLEKEIWDKTYAEFVKLIPFCPEEKHLVHSDYNFDNVLAKDGKVTGVIDWENSMYGDFLYDIAWMQFFTKDFDYEQAYLEYSKLTKNDIPHFDERLLCYKLYIGLGTLSFYAYSGQKDKYERSIKKLSDMISKNNERKSL